MNLFLLLPAYMINSKNDQVVLLQQTGLEEEKTLNSKHSDFVSYPICGRMVELFTACQLI